MAQGLKKWFQEKWVDIGARKKDGSYQECGRKSASSSKRKYPKCVPLAKATQMTSSQKASAVKRKRSAPNTGPKPSFVKTKAFAGGLVPDVSTAMSMASQASPQDYIQYKQSGQMQTAKPIEQQYEAVKAPQEETKTTEAYAGKFIDVELDGKKYSNKSYKDYYKGLI